MSNNFDSSNADDFLLESTSTSEHNTDDRKEIGSKWPSFKLYSSAVLVSIGASFCFGYECLITNPAGEAFMQFINSTHTGTNKTITNKEELASIWGFTVSMLFWGCTVGSLLISKILDVFGRKNGLLFTFTVQATSVGLAILSYFAHSLFLYTASRFILGAALAASLGIAPVFVTECSPSACRGVTSLTIGILFQIGTVVGAIVAMPQLLGTITSWWILYLIELIIIIIVIVLTLFIKETPGYLLQHNDPDGAVKSIQFYYKLDEAAALKERKEMEKTVNNEPAYGLFAVLKDPSSRYGTLVGTAILVCMLMSGIAAINAFAYSICKSVGLNSLQASIGNAFICFVTVLGVLFSNVLIGRFGRRPLLLVGFCTLVVFNICLPGCMFMFETTKVKAIGWIVVFFICVYNFFISTAVIPIAFFITGELVNQKGRGAACTWANFMFNLSRSLMLLGYFPLATLIGGPLSYFLLFCPACIFAVFVVYFYLPETKGKSPEQTKEGIRKLPTMKNLTNPGEEDDSSESSDGRKSKRRKGKNTPRGSSKSKTPTSGATSTEQMSAEEVQKKKKKTVSSELGQSVENAARSREPTKDASREPGNTMLFSQAKDGTPEGTKGTPEGSKAATPEGSKGTPDGSKEKMKNSNEANKGLNEPKSEAKSEAKSEVNEAKLVGEESK